MEKSGSQRGREGGRRRGTEKCQMESGRGGRERETKRGRERGGKHRTHSHTHKRLHTRDLDGEMFTCFRHIVLIVYNFFEF